MMFPFQKGELCFQISNNNNNEQDVKVGVSEAELLKYNQHANPPNKRKVWSKKSLPKQDDKTNSKHININGDDDVANKKMIHREIERQRRHEMANLYSSLRSILPFEYVKGKRSMSDHISEAAKYIKDLEMNIKELGDKRVQLKETICSSPNKLHAHLGCSSSSTSSSSRDDCNVSVHSFSKSIEIEICTGVVEEDPFPLSRVLEVLNEEGLDVVSCVSTQVNNRCIYVIHCQVEDVSSMDSCHLQQRLYNQIRS